MSIPRPIGERLATGYPGTHRNEFIDQMASIDTYIPGEDVNRVGWLDRQGCKSWPSPPSI